MKFSAGDVVALVKDVYVGTTLIASGTEITIAEKSDYKSDYYVIERDSLPNNVRKRLHDGHPVIIHRDLITESCGRVADDIDIESLMSVLEVR